MTSTLRACALVVLGAAPLLSQPSEKPWSLRVSEAVIARTPQTTARWDYTAGVVLGAIQRVGESRHDARLLDYVKRNMDRWIKPDGTIDGYKMEEFNLDQIAQGRVLFSLQPKVARYRKAADLLREQLRRQPRTAEGGFWHKQIYPHQMWADGIYMASPFLAQYAAVFGEPAALDDAVKQVLVAERHLRDAKTGLLYHGWDESKKERWANPRTGLSSQFWGRGVGWYAMGVADVLAEMPKDHPKRVAVIAVLRRLATAIARVQDPATGTWWQVLDAAGRPGNYLEASASAMFVYALTKGVGNGWLDAKRFAPVAARGYAGTVNLFVAADATGDVHVNKICKVAGLGGDPYRDGTYAYYIGTEVVPDDPKGVGAFILASAERGR